MPIGGIKTHIKPVYLYTVDTKTQRSLPPQEEYTHTLTVHYIDAAGTFATPLILLRLEHFTFPTFLAITPTS